MLFIRFLYRWQCFTSEYPGTLACLVGDPEWLMENQETDAGQQQLCYYYQLNRKRGDVNHLDDPRNADVDYITRDDYVKGRRVTNVPFRPGIL